MENLKTMIKVLSVSTVNAVAVVILYYIVATLLHAVTKQFFDRINFSSVVTFVVCFGVLIILSRLEARRWEIKFVAIMATSISILVIVGVGMALAIKMIADGIG